MKKFKLTHREVSTAKPKAKAYTLRDGGGLILRIIPSGARNWVLEYKRPDGRRSSAGLGGFPSLGLAEARQAASNFLARVAEGVDVVLESKKSRAAELEALNTFKDVSLKWMDFKQHSISADHLVDIRRRLEMHVFPALGNIQITEINAPLAINSLRKLQRDGKLETLKRVIQIINQIMRYAVNSGVIEHNRLAEISAIFPPPTKTAMRSIRPEALADFLADIDKTQCHPRVKQLLYFQLATMLRPAEAACVEWEWFDFDRKVLTLPPEVMKMKREHRVPLNCYLLDILDGVERHKASEYVFFGVKHPREHINSQTVNAVVRRAGWGDRLVSHGFRSIASTYLNEAGFNADWIEAALAHADENEVRRAYNRSDYLEQRRSMMAAWGKKVLDGVNHME
ncbi:tyrosine-type recombinase/integrase [Umboniibacter marinipuniceus]|uniref:Integrase n=1 Tax=Umboniibacter marinipuniceus TaxID=569599 RepID=A0A3M0AGN3_9GAMM|nr:tyrosine-type recombinase/integrase [Umboniibacter marinipuniceus]RMA82719.1 integrase [Umboniibacter marinipuniceus]